MRLSFATPPGARRASGDFNLPDELRSVPFLSAWSGSVLHGFDSGLRLGGVFVESADASADSTNTPPRRNPLSKPCSTEPDQALRNGTDRSSSGRLKSPGARGAPGGVAKLRGIARLAESSATRAAKNQARR